MPTKDDIKKGIVRFVAVFATLFAFELQKGSGDTVHAYVVAAVGALPLAIEKTFIGV